MPKFLKFKCGFLAEIGRYLAGKWPTRVRSSQNSGQNFFHHQISKIDDFIQESRTPPQNKKKKCPFFWGGGFVSYMELMEHDCISPVLCEQEAPPEAGVVT